VGQGNIRIYEEEGIFGHMGIGIGTTVMKGTTVYDPVLSIGVLKIKIHLGNESASHYISTVHFIIETRYTHQRKTTISTILKLSHEIL
jgi:hypothetical protein